MGVKLEQVIELMLSRASCPKLGSPAPDDAQLAVMLQCALRAPDHARLHPWRYLSIRDNARNALGELFAEEQRQLNPDMAADKQDKNRNMLQRAPLVIVAICSPQVNSKVPYEEQLLSAGSGVQHLQLAANALGFHSIWRTGDMVHSGAVRGALGLESHEQIIGFIYIGSAAEIPAVSHLPVADFYRPWTPDEVQK